MHHRHSHGVPSARRLGVTIALHGVITLAQLVGGVLSGSIALLSDALHNASDVVALVISAIAEKFIPLFGISHMTFQPRYGAHPGTSLIADNGCRRHPH